MKKITISAALFCLTLAASAVFAQTKAVPQMKTANFAGSWELDKTKSKMPEASRVESIALNVTQSEKDLKIETTTKRGAPTEVKRADNNPMMNGGEGRGGMRAGMMDGTQEVTYSLDGKETKLETPGIPGAGATLTAKMEKDGKLKLSTSRTFNGQMGEMTMTTKETWELMDGGKNLKITRERETPRGTDTSEMFFTKKQ